MDKQQEPTNGEATKAQFVNPIRSFQKEVISWLINARVATGDDEDFLYNIRSRYPLTFRQNLKLEHLMKEADIDPDWVRNRLAEARG